MKKYHIVCFIIALSIAFPSISEAYQKVYLVNNQTLNLREKPTTKSKVIDKLELFQCLKSEGEEKMAGGLLWIKVETPYGLVGWVASKYIVETKGGYSCFNNNIDGDNEHLVVQSGHEILLAEVTPNGKYAITTSSGHDNNILLWDISSGNLLRVLAGHNLTIMGLNISSDSKRIAAAEAGNSFKLWELESGRLLNTFICADCSILEMKQSPDLSQIATLGDSMYNCKMDSITINNKNTPIQVCNMVLNIWDTKTGKLQKRLIDHDFENLEINFDWFNNGELFYLLFTPSKNDESAKMMFILNTDTWEIINETAINIENSIISPVIVQNKVFNIYCKRRHDQKCNNLVMSEITLEIDDKNDIQQKTTEISLSSYGLNYSKVEMVISDDAKTSYIFDGKANILAIDNITMKLIKSIKIEGEIKKLYYINGKVIGLKSLYFSDEPEIGKYWSDERKWQEFTKHKVTSDILNAKYLSNDTIMVKSGDSQQSENKIISLKDLNVKYSSNQIIDIDDSGTIGINKDYQIVNINNGNILSTVKQPVEKADFYDLSPDGNIVTFYQDNDDNEIYYFIDAKTGENMMQISNVANDTNKKINYFPDNNRIAVVAYEKGRKVIKIISLKNGKNIATAGRKQDIDGNGPISINHDGRFIAADVCEEQGSTIFEGCNTNKTYIYSTDTGKIAFILNNDYGRYVPSETVIFSKDGKYIATGGTNHGIHIWSAKNGALIKVLDGHKDGILSLDFSNDNKYLMSTSNDETMKIWDVETGEDVLTYLQFKSGDYLFITNEGYYMTTKDGAKHASWRKNMKIYPFEQFDLKYNRPDKVLQKISGANPDLIRAYKKAFEKRIRRWGITESELNAELNLPQLILKTQSGNSDTKQLQLKFEAKDEKYKLDRIAVYVNDVPIYGIQGYDISNQGSKDYENSLQIELSQGENKIQVSVFNEKGVESLRETIYVKYQGQAIKPDLYVLAIGISNYKNDAYKLNYAAKDAIDISEFFRGQSDNYGNVKIKTLTDNDVTRENINASKAFFTQSSVDDTVVLFVSGHGLLNESLDYYFATYDVDAAQPEARGLPYEEFENLLDGIPARKKLFLIDTCFSGELDDDAANVMIAKNIVDSGRDDKVLIDKDKGVRVVPSFVDMTTSYQMNLFNDLRRGTGAVIISSSGGHQVSKEDPKWENGAFTEAILAGLNEQSADSNNDGKIFVSELRDFVIDEVVQMTGGNQTPTVRRDNISNDFVIVGKTTE